MPNSGKIPVREPAVSCPLLQPWNGSNQFLANRWRQQGVGEYSIGSDTLDEGEEQPTVIFESDGLED